MDLFFYILASLSAILFYALIKKNKVFSQEIYDCLKHNNVLIQ